MSLRKTRGEHNQELQASNLSNPQEINLKINQGTGIGKSNLYPSIKTVRQNMGCKHNLFLNRCQITLNFQLKKK
jgi:hypothetical protein